MSKSLVIVESPAKARTIGQILGHDFVVEASIGHVRDLPESAAEIPPSHRDLPWARTAVDVDNDFEPLYVLTARGKEQVRKLKALCKEATDLYLATDEDREGEAIAWHLLEVLKPRIPIHRLAFHEITAKAIREALAHPRDIDMNLVHAQETRRVVDRLVGYNVSPVLWRKVKSGLSAGRVQSVAVRLLVERERERMAFQSATWWDVTARVTAPNGAFSATVVRWRGRTLATGRDFDDRTGALLPARDVLLMDEALAGSVCAALEGGQGAVSKVERSEFTEKPARPFTTSTLQQEANRKLRWSARTTMAAAQRLYENGWITYMRTDSTALSDEAVAAARRLIAQDFGPDFLTRTPRVYPTQTKNAQEAHEAIRPAGDSFRPVADCRAALGNDEASLYELIWRRTLACQMRDATGHRMAVELDVGDARLRATGKTYSFHGFRRAYVEVEEEQEGDPTTQERVLPEVNEGLAVATSAADGRPHATQPPARLTEATLIRELERRGIGRPSTYASIIDVIQRRDYVVKKGNALVPTWTAFAVTRLMEQHFPDLVDYGFTAQLEDGLDAISLGRLVRTDYLSRFYRGHDGTPGLVEQVDLAQKTADPREVCGFTLGVHEGDPVVARVGKWGTYVEHGGRRHAIQDGTAPADTRLDDVLPMLQAEEEGPRPLGVDPESGLDVTVRNGPYGYYVQLGEVEAGKKKGKKARPRRQSLFKEMDPKTIDLETALALLSLPRTLGANGDGEPVVAADGRFGPYVKAGSVTRSLPASLSPLDVTLEQALEVLAAPAPRRSAPGPIGSLGQDGTGRKISVRKGRFGPYVTDGETNATLPRDADPTQVTLEQAVELLAARRARLAEGGVPAKAPPKARTRSRK